MRSLISRPCSISRALAARWSCLGTYAVSFTKPGSRLFGPEPLASPVSECLGGWVPECSVLALRISANSVNGLYAGLFCVFAIQRLNFFGHSLIISPSQAGRVVSFHLIDSY